MQEVLNDPVCKCGKVCDKFAFRQKQFDGWETLCSDCYVQWKGKVKLTQFTFCYWCESQRCHKELVIEADTVSVAWALLVARVPKLYGAWLQKISWLNVADGHDKPDIVHDSFRQIYDDVISWSQKTFGPTSSRGPVGPLKHLAKEILVELLGYNPVSFNEFISQPRAVTDPCDISEFADLAILLCDAVSRAGHSYGNLCKAGMEKMTVNKARTYPKPKGDDISEHVRGDLP